MGGVKDRGVVQELPHFPPLRLDFAAAKEQVLDVLKLELASLTQTIIHPQMAGPPVGKEPMVSVVSR